MKLIKLIEIHRELLNLLRKIGFKLDFIDYIDMYYYFKSERVNPRNTFDKIMSDIKEKFGVGHTKAWEVIKLLDKEVL